MCQAVGWVCCKERNRSASEASEAIPSEEWVPTGRGRALVCVFGVFALMLYDSNPSSICTRPPNIGPNAGFAGRFGAPKSQIFEGNDTLPRCPMLIPDQGIAQLPLRPKSWAPHRSGTGAGQPLVVSQQHTPPPRLREQRNGQNNTWAPLFQVCITGIASGVCRLHF